MSTPDHVDPGAARHEALVQAVLGEVRALSTAMDQLDQRAAQHFGLNRTDQQALDVISQEAEISPLELARAVGISASAVTTVIDRLEAAGYVVRQSSTRDRRRTVLRITRRTDRVGAELFGPILAASVEHARGYVDDELVVIAKFLAHHRRTITARLDLPDRSMTPDRRPG